MAKLLVVDDQDSVRFTLREILSDAGHEVIEASNVKAALARVSDVDLVLTDYAMPELSGLDLLEALRKSYAGLPVIMLTARGSEQTAVAALKAGAADYLVKPANVDALCLAVERALEVANLRRENRVLRAGQNTSFIGQSSATQELLRLVERVASRGMNLLVRGETGTGKELIAGLLHAHSPRARGPLVRFNCGAVPETLAASELFGHVRGAFTGAETNRDGFFQQADGGTLILDEIAELPLQLQPLLLRALQQGEVQRVGSSSVERVDVRVIGCTHRDLRSAPPSQFREDLYFRLAVMEIVVPALRERPDDIAPLAEHFVRKHQERFGMQAVQLGSEVTQWLANQPWPGNVRELENCIVRMMALSDSGELEVPKDAQAVSQSSSGPLRARMAAFETQILRETMHATGGNQSEAARRLGITRVTLIDKLKRHGLKKPAGA